MLSNWDFQFLENMIDKVPNKSYREEMDTQEILRKASKRILTLEIQLHLLDKKMRL